MRIASLHLHPVKAMRAVDVSSARVEERGFAGDRRWLAVDAAGVFLTQRSHAALARINAAITKKGVRLSAEGAGEIEVERPQGSVRRNVVVWDAQISAAAANGAASAFLSDFLGEEAHLVYMDEKALRFKASVWTEAPVAVSFADAFPVLVATTGSLAALNRDIEKHGGTAVPMARFRPNIVIGCDEPWAEDRWTRIKIGAAELDLVKPSDRCIVTTTDQKTGARMGKEPLAALARIHRSTDPRINGVLFGVNAVPRTFGEIHTDEAVEIIA
jgi:uncharacterized protein YcbX